MYYFKVSSLVKFKLYHQRLMLDCVRRVPAKKLLPICYVKLLKMQKYFIFCYSLFLLSHYFPGLFPNKINLKKSNIQRGNKTYLTNNQPYCKAASSTEQQKQTRNGDRHPCIEWDLSPQSWGLSGRRHFLPYRARPL
jgi:hypothetical protein